MEVEARQSAKLSDVVRCVPKEQPQRRQWATGKQQTTDKRLGQTTGRQQTADTCNRRKSSEWPMTTKLAVKHTKITSNGQKVNKIKQCAQREHVVPRTGNTGPATSSMSGHGYGCCCCCGWRCSLQLSLQVNRVRNMLPAFRQWRRRRLLALLPLLLLLLRLLRRQQHNPPADAFLCTHN